jgi:outer membrane protein OmpA-like peptidoglycan-associated protein
MIVERDGEFYVRKDEDLLLRRPGATVQTEEFADGITRTTVNRDDGSRVVTIRDSGGFVLKRTRILPDGTEIVLIDETQYADDRGYADYDAWNDDYDPWQGNYDTWVPDDRYAIDYGEASSGALRDTLMAPPVLAPDRAFSLRDVRDNERVRSLMPRIDLDAVHFASGSAAIDPSEAEGLAAVGNTMSRLIAENPREVFLIEGHTDAVGSNLMNLALSDRRAEAVALALTEYFSVPPENLVVEGYGERYLKIDTEGPSQENRRVSVRRITPLIDRTVAAQ